ncbi:MAG: hypothetical protein ABIO67_07890 [Mycobacteriales bacterium]
MRDALKSYLALASGLTDISKQRAVTAAKALVAQGEATAEQVTSLAEDLVQQSRSNREAVTALVKFELDRGLSRVGLASHDVVDELSRRVRELEGQVRSLGGSAPAKKAPAKKAPAKKAPAKKAVKRAPAKKAAAKKAPAKRPGSSS